MNCTDYQRWLSPYVDGQLSSDERDQVDAHLQSCVQCQGALASLQQMLQTLHAMGTPEAPDLLPGIHARLSRKPAWRRFAQRFIAPWPQSLPWHGLALAMSAMLIIVVTHLPTRSADTVRVRGFGYQIAGQRVAQYEPSNRDAQMLRRELGEKHVAMVQSKDQSFFKDDTKHAAPASITTAPHRADDSLMQLASGRSLGAFNESDKLRQGADTSTTGVAGGPAESVNGLLGVGHAESSTVVDQPAPLNTPESTNERMRQLAKVSAELDELRSEEGKVATPILEAPQTAPAAPPVGGAYVASVTGDTFAARSVIGGESVRAKTESSPLWSFEVAAEDQVCDADADCTIVETRCDACACGTSVNKLHEAQYIARWRTLCRDYHGGTCDLHCPALTARCTNHRCIRSTSTPTE